MRHRLAIGMIVASSVAMLTACAGATTAPATSPVTPPATAPAEIPRPNPLQAAPPIPALKNPRDVTAVSGRPCELLTSQQATGFRLDLPPDQLSGLHGTMRCMWTTTTTPARAIVRIVDVNTSTDGPALEVIYDRDRGLPFFELTDIAGDPAIVTRSNATLPICAIKIKTAEGQSLSVNYEDKELAKNPQNSCEIGKRVAAAVLMNVPPKS